MQDQRQERLEGPIPSLQAIRQEGHVHPEELHEQKWEYHEESDDAACQAHDEVQQHQSREKQRPSLAAKDSPVTGDHVARDDVREHEVPRGIQHAVKHEPAPERPNNGPKLFKAQKQGDHPHERERHDERQCAIADQSAREVRAPLWVERLHAALADQGSTLVELRPHERQKDAAISNDDAVQDPSDHGQGHDQSYEKTSQRPYNRLLHLGLHVQGVAGPLEQWLQWGQVMQAQLAEFNRVFDGLARHADGEDRQQGRHGQHTHHESRWAM
mmetsp:Transcript_70459/g.215830  ORF Transcript_70459/g.215830 Transcript_70459/m.215830 type:complete len:271 (+) Transcript_70459:255-1067(+)